MPDEAAEGTQTKRDSIRVRTRVCAASALSSVLAILAFPPIDLWPVAFLFPIPLMWAAAQIERHRLTGAIAITLGTMPMWAWMQQWVFSVSLLGAPLLVLYLSAWSGLYAAITSWIAQRLRRSTWVVGPIVWAGLEFLRGDVVLGGYPWMLAGHPLVGWAWLAGAGAIVGAYGVSLMTVAVASGLGGTLALRGARRLRSIGAVLLVFAAWAGMAAFSRPETSGSLRVTLVQTNVPQSIRHGWSPANRVADLDRMLGLTIAAGQAEPTPELIVWPETMFPGDSLDPVSLNEERAANLFWITPLDAAWPILRWTVWRGPDGIDEPVHLDGPREQMGSLAIPTSVAADSVLTWQGRIGVPLLIGADGIEGLAIDVAVDGTVDARWDRRFNSSYLIEDGRVGETRYDKIHLTPFGEVMPVISRWDWLESALLSVGVGARGMSFDLEAGSGPVIHTVRSDEGLVRVATPICFEGVMSSVCRGLTFVDGERQADLLIQMTNEGWFGDFDTGRLQHLQAVRWRAIELGTPVLRAANTGISALIGADGRVLEAGVDGGPSNAEGLLAVDAPLGVGVPVFGRLGNVIGWLSAAALGGLAVLAAIAARRQRREGRTAEKETR